MSPVSIRCLLTHVCHRVQYHFSQPFRFPIHSSICRQCHEHERKHSHFDGSTVVTDYTTISTQKWTSITQSTLFVPIQVTTTTEVSTSPTTVVNTVSSTETITSVSTSQAPPLRLLFTMVQFSTVTYSMNVTSTVVSTSVSSVDLSALGQSFTVHPSLDSPLLDRWLF